MIKAVLLVLGVMIVVIALVFLADYVNRAAELRDESEKLRKHKYDKKSGVFYDPDNLERTEKNGVISFKSKDDGKKNS